MFSTLRYRFGAPGVIAVIALVFAMVGGTFAATGSGGGKATTSAKAKKGPRGPKGPKGSTGATGPAGPQGLPGAKGDTGAAGTNGTNGSNGKTVLSGSGAPAAGLGTDGDFYIDTAADKIYGPKASGAWGSSTSLVGPEGESGFTETLPPGKTETGTYFFHVAGVVELQEAISFNIPLPEAFGESQVVAVPESGPVPTECENSEHPEAASTANPEAKPGFFCLFVVFGATPGISNPTSFTPGVATVGAIVAAASDSLGTWAVTAPEE